MDRNPEANEPARLRSTGERIDRLMQEVGKLVTPPVQQRIDELLGNLLDLYGAGLQRIVAIALESGARDERLRAGLADDEVVATLLLLHGLHPVAAGERIRRALESTRAVLHAQGLVAELVGIDESGVASLRVIGSEDGRPRQWGAIRAALVQTVEESAPEVTAVEIDGLGGSEPGPQLVQLGGVEGPSRVAL